MAVRKRKADDGVTAEVRDNVVEAPIVQRRLTVSEILRDRRIECRLDLDHVAQVLMIKPSVLTDIEAGHFDQLPGPAYAVGFVRSYATYLGLDAEALVLRFKAEVAEVARRPHLNFPLPLSDKRVPTGPILIICVLLAALTYGGWYYFSEHHGRLTDMVPSVPNRLTHLLGPEQMKQEITGAQPVNPPQAPAAPASNQPQPGTTPAAGQAPAPAAGPLPQPAPTVVGNAAPAAQPATQAPAAPTSASQASGPTPGPATAADAGAQPTGGAVAPPPPADADGVPPVEDHTSPPASQPTVPAAPDLAQPAVADAGKAAPQTSYGAPEGQARIVLHASAESWIQVRDGQGNLLITRILKPGESYNVPNQPGLMMVTGNAGGLDISVDGTALPHLGVSGQVVRDVTLDPDRLLPGKPHAN